MIGALVTALALQAECAARLGIASDAARYGGLLKVARQLYVSKYFHSATGCFGNCTDISQIFGLAMVANAGSGLLSKAEDARAWDQALAWFGEDGKYEGRFGGGIVSLKLLYPLLDAHGMSDLGLKVSEASEVGVARRTSGACAERRRSVCGAKDGEQRDRVDAVASPGSKSTGEQGARTAALGAIVTARACMVG